MRWVLSAKIVIFVFWTQCHTILCDTSFKPYPDRYEIGRFTIKILTLEANQLQFAFSKANQVRIENEYGNVCVEYNNLRNHEIKGLPCQLCKDNNLTVILKFTNSNGTNVSKTYTFSEDGERKRICNIKPKKFCIGENVTFTNTLTHDESCRWVFRDVGGHFGCCYSNHNNKGGGCDPRMQHSACRKGVRSPVISSQGNSCSLHIQNVEPRDVGNYLSSFEHGTPSFKEYLEIRGCAQDSFSGVLIVIVISIILLFIVCILMHQDKKKC